MIVNGVFMSKILYSVQIFGNVFFNEQFDGLNERNHSFTKMHLHSLQLLQNCVCRLLTGHKYDTPITVLLNDSGMLSVNQLVAFSTITTVFKIKQSGEPVYLAQKLKQQQGRDLRHRDIRINFNLARAREGFLYRGKILFNALPHSIQMENRVGRFKKLMKKWIKEFIPAVPT